MTDRRLMPVQLEVIKEVLVDRILTAAVELYPGNPQDDVRRALEADVDLPVCDGRGLDMRMRRIGYLSRIVEADLFEPAREPMPGLAAQLTQRITAAEDWSAAVVALCEELAREEPLPKPRPEDLSATSWKVPGPGGHVRHYVVAAAIADALSSDMNGDAGLADGVDDAGELKRSWTFGFAVRCCEEALPPASDLSHR